jgi:hypothetical protein
MRIITGILLSLFATLTLAASPSGTAIIAPTTASITDAAGNVWTISSAVGATTGQVFINGVADTHAVKVSQLAYVNGVMWTMGSVGATYPQSGPWYFKSNNKPTDLWHQNNLSPLAACTTPVPPVLQANLTWTAVTAYTSGAVIPNTVPVTYTVYQGTSATNLVQISTGSTTTAIVTTGLAAGHTYFWAIVANAGGVSSAQSNIGSKSF